MERYSIGAKIRKETGKGVARRLRQAGLVPAVIYGKSRAAEALTIDPKVLKDKMRGNAIFDLTLTGGEEEIKEIAMIKEVQKNPIKGDIIHIDFQTISMDEKITVSVAINLLGVPVGTKEGGVLQQLLREIEIECLPMDIPEKIDVDITELDMGDSLLVSDLIIGENVDLVTNLDEVVATIVTPTEEIEEEVEEDEEFIEPEVIGEEGEEEGEETGETEETEEKEE